MQPVDIQPIIDKPLFDPTYLNMEYVFSKVVVYTKGLVDILSNPHTWTVVGIVSVILSIFCIAVIIFSLIRLVEMQIYDKKEIDHEIHKAHLRQEEIERTANPKWHYIQTLIESPNDSDWRVSIIEADSLMEEILKDRGLSGTTVAELLESAKGSGYSSIQSAWDAHTVRNKIAHDGADFSLSQIEGRRVIKLYQNFFEELGII